MKRFLISVLALTLASSTVWAQSKNAKTAKAKPATADCSSTTDGQITDNVQAKLAGTASLKDQTSVARMLFNSSSTRTCQRS